MTQKFKHWYRLNRKEIALSALTAVCIVLFLAAFSLWTGKAQRMMLFIPLLFAGKFFAAWKINARVRTGFTGYFFITDLTCSLAVIAAAAICAGQYREPELTCIVILLGIMFYILEITNLNP